MKHKRLNIKQALKVKGCSLCVSNWIINSQESFDPPSSLVRFYGAQNSLWWFLSTCFTVGRIPRLCVHAFAGMEWVQKRFSRSCRSSCSLLPTTWWRWPYRCGVCAAATSLQTFELFLGSCSFHVGFIYCCICHFQACDCAPLPLLWVFSQSSLTDGCPPWTPSVTQLNKPFHRTVVFSQTSQSVPQHQVIYPSFNEHLGINFNKIPIVIKSCAFTP